MLPICIPNCFRLHAEESGEAGEETARHRECGDVLRKHGRRNHLPVNKEVMNVISQKENKVVFLKSWNEWGEGNYMEPDLKYGHGYIDALREELNAQNLR